MVNEHTTIQINVNLPMSYHANENPIRQRYAETHA
jgi:hypothetical protein